MPLTLPERITGYNIGASSTADELTVLALIFAEAGRHVASLSRFCADRLSEINTELARRGIRTSAERLFDFTGSALESMTINELFSHYRRWPARHEQRRTEGRELFTFFYERRIVDQLATRRAATLAEQFKIDYCTLSYSIAIESLAHMLGLPAGNAAAKFRPDARRAYTPAELYALIRLYTAYGSIAERERLVEYIDLALNLLKDAKTDADTLRLASQLAEISRKGIVQCPEWLSDTLARGIGNKSIDDAAKVIPLLTLATINGDDTATRKAQRIINRCYKACLEAPTIDALHTAVTCCDYVRRFSPRKMADAWNRLCTTVNGQCSTIQIIRLLEIADELPPFAHESKTLTAYRQFVCSLFPTVLSASEMTRLDVAVLKELVTRRTLDAYDRRAYQLALEYESRSIYEF